MGFPKLKLMISSRSDRSTIADEVGNLITLREARQRLKALIEAETFCGGGLVEVWINEAEHGDYNETDWDECLKQAADCDLFIALYDGDAGWAAPGASVGICQAEFDTALRLAPGKVKIIRLPTAKITAGDTINQSFLDALNAARRFETRIKDGWPELRDKMLGLVREMILGAAHEGTREYRKSGGNLGQALDWSRLAFAERAKKIAITISESATRRSASVKTAPAENTAIVEIDGVDVLFVCHGAPRSLSVAASRQMVGQPFLGDHNVVRDIEGGVVGPIHLIGCPKSVTEAQAVSLLGYPDFTVVPGSFGVYAACQVQRVQLCLLANCADPGSTRNSVDRFFEWLERSRELPSLMSRAKSRRRIVDAIIQG